MEMKATIQRLRAAVERWEKPAVLLSGGVDSTLLAYLMRRVMGKNTLAVTVCSPLNPDGEEERARHFAGTIGLSHHFLDVDEMERKPFRENPPERCYLCRRLRDERVLDWARSMGCDVIMDGMNVSDLDDYRPGLRAADEDGIVHPLIEAGLTKAQIREMARGFGLQVWDRPSEPCLASRFPYAFPIDREKLERVRLAEKALHLKGFKEVRVRYFPFDTAVVALSMPQRIFNVRESVTGELRALGFRFVTLDLEGLLSGSLNRLLLNGDSDKGVISP